MNKPSKPIHCTDYLKAVDIDQQIKDRGLSCKWTDQSPDQIRLRRHIGKLLKIQRLEHAYCGEEDW